MGNRPLFVLSILRDYDGYEQDVCFATFDFKEAIRRYKFLINYVKEEWFLNHDVLEEDMDMISYALLKNATTSIKTALTENGENEFILDIK